MSLRALQNVKDIVQPKKRGVKSAWYQSIRLDLVHDRRYFLGTLKGLTLCFKLKKPVSAFSAKKVWSLF
jgi:hypothetical protein